MSDQGRGGLFAWVGQRDAIQAFRRRIDAKSDRRKQLEQHAATLAETGDRTFNPTTPLRAGDGQAVAALLYAQSIRASLSALERTVTALMEDESLRRAAARALPDSMSLERLRDLLDRAPAADECEELRVEKAEVDGLARVSRALLDIAQEPERDLRRASVRRLSRSAVLLIVLVVGVGIVASLGLHFARGPNLAEGRPWKTSSEYRGFSPEAGICDGKKTKIFFHTNRETQPWVEVDLEAPTTIRRVDVRNRRDCCRDRAFPLVVEGSLDGQTWNELGRRKEPFNEWTLEPAPTTTRYVRARSLKRTYLHLEAFEIR